VDDRSPGWSRFIEAWSGQMRLVVGMVQVHGNRVQAVDIPPAGGGTSPRIVEACDGLVTNAPGLLLTATVADCVPLFLRDEARGAIGLLHAGWRGTAGGILAAGIEAMHDAFGTVPEEVSVYMGPSIAGSCYSVGEEVARRFSRWIDPLPPGAGRIRLDLRAVLARQAVELGVRSGRIFRSERCTHCRTDLFYSHRAESGRCGRMAAFMGIRARISP
jgi:hypothetical protein